MLKVIQSYEHTQTMLIGGRSFPTSCLVEDDLGIRWYLTQDSKQVDVLQWVKAATDGAAAILVPGPEFLAMSSEVFMDSRKEHGQSYLIDQSSWQSFADLPDYPDLVARTNEPVPVTASGESFVHLHNHSEYSALDGLSKASEIASVVASQGGFAVGITDHGNCAGHPDFQVECDKAGIKPIFGMEAYFVHDRKPRLSDFTLPSEMDPTSKEALSLREEFKNRINDYYHLVLIAIDDVGLRNLWAMSTEAYRDGLHAGKPRLDWEILAAHSQGVVATSACLRGPLTHKALLEGNEVAALENLGRLLEIFPGRFFIEVHTNQLPEQLAVNRELVSLGREYGVPLLAVVDSHYPTKEDQEAHRTWLSVQTNSDVADDSSLFAGGQDYHIKTEREVREALSYLPDDVVQESIANTARIANACTARIKGEATPPIYSKRGGHEADAEKLLDLCLENWSKVEGKREGVEVYIKRFEYEYSLLVKKLFCGYYLMWADICAYAKSNGVLVGPGRGSGGGSLVAYLAGITDLDPVEQDLLFERFMTEGRTSLPDFDVDFPASRKRFMQEYARNQWGEDRVTVVGSVIRLKNKGVIQKLGMALKSTLPPDFYLDQKEVSKIIERAEGDTAGLGLSWTDLWEKAGKELDPFREKYPYLFEMADTLVGRVSTYGQHAAGLVIATEGALTAELPLRRASEEGHMIAQFDKDVLEGLGFVKFDMLTLRNLDTIQECVDLIKERRGRSVDVYSWREEYLDPQVWEEISLAYTLGIFQIETTLGTQYTKRMRPRSLADLADLVTIVRPGPRNSGLTESYLKRRDGLESVTFPDERLEAVLAKTYGTLLYQEDIMQTCMILGGYDSNEADQIRKILGKKQVEKVVAAGQEFVSRAVDRGMRQDDAAALWAQMAEFAKYCLTGDTEIWLAASNHHTATMNVELAYRRLHTPLRPPVIGRSKRGDEFAGPCDVCGQTESGHWVRGRCNACYVWVQKFRDPNRGVHSIARYADDRIRPARILDVISQGPQQVFRVTLENGRSLTATGNHRHLSDKGYREVRDLAVGDRLLVDGGYQMPTKQESSSRNRKTRLERQRVGIVNAIGQQNYGYADGGHTIWRSWREATPKVCDQCGTTEGRIEHAHLNGDHQDQRWENYAWLCSSCHQRYDYAVNDRRRRWQKGHLVDSSAIVSIEDMGLQDTYDVVMEAPHNFVANGILTHNSFGKAHAFGYATLAFWTGWFKFHYPIEFLTSALSSVDKDRIPDFIKEARRMGFSVMPPDINESGVGFRAGDLSVRYGLDSVKGIGSAAAHIQAAQPFSSFEDFMERVVEPKGSKVDRGKTALLAKIGAFDALVPNRRGLEQKLLMDKNGEATQCVRKNLAVVSVNNLPCIFDWDSEEAPVNPRTGKKTKRKPPPKKCTKACRQYTAPPPLDLGEVEPYTDVDIRNIEHDLLGVYLSSTPFDLLDPEHREITRSQAEIINGSYVPEGNYLIAGTLTKKRPYVDNAGRPMGFVAFDTEVGDLDAVCFNSVWEKYQKDLVTGDFYAAEIERTSRGFNLLHVMHYQP